MLISSIFTWPVKALSWISFYLDMIVYRIAGWSYKVFYIMGRVTLDADDTVQLIVNKIYTILLIFMVFVVAYNMLLYIINPDRVTSSGKDGPADLVKRIAISLIVIVAFPLFFDLLYDVQRDIVEYNVIGTIILGGSSGSTTTNGNQTCVVSGVGASGDALVADVYSAFLYPLNGLEANDCCNGSISQAQIKANTVTGEYCTAYLDARATGGIGSFHKIKDEALKDVSSYQYLGIVSTAAGAIMAIYFLGFCINLGIRLFKLLALELVAPIPALMDLIPGKSGTLERWFKEVFKVYMQVFLYQALVFSMVWLATLVPGLISQIASSIDASTSGVTTGFVLLAKVLIIMALFQGAKEIPKMLSDVLGIKGGDGLLKSGFLNAMGIGATALGVAGNATKNFVGHAKDGNWGRAATGALAGGFSALSRNMWGMRNAKSIKDIQNVSKRTNMKVQQKRLDRTIYRAEHEHPLFSRIEDIGRKVNTGVSDFVGLTQDYDENAHATEQGQYIAKSKQLEYLNTYMGKFKAAYDVINNDENVKYYQGLIDQMERTGIGRIEVGKKADGRPEFMTLAEAVSRRDNAAGKAFTKKRGDIVSNILDFRQEGAKHQELKHKGVIDNNEFQEGGRYDLNTLDYATFKQLSNEVLGKRYDSPYTHDSTLGTSIKTLSNDEELMTRMAYDKSVQDRKKKAKEEAAKVTGSSDTTKEKDS